MLGNLTRASRKPEQRAMQVTPWGDWAGTGGNAAGMNVSSDSALSLSTVYGCVAFIADTIATLPRDVYKKNGNGTTTEVSAPPWMDTPNTNCDGIDFITQTLVSLLLDGNAYWAYEPDGNGLPSQVWVLDPNLVHIVDDGSRRPVYFYRGSQIGAPFLHIRGLTKPGCYKGLSVVEHARQTFGIGLAGDQHAASFLQNGGTLAGVLTTDQDLTEPQLKALAGEWKRTHGGPYNAGNAGVLDNGAKWQPIGITPEQAQFLESRKFSAAQICGQLFLMDPSLLGIPLESGSNLTYANLADRGTHTVTFTLARWLIRLERAYTQLLPRGWYEKFNVDALKRSDLKARFDAYRIALDPAAPFMTVNEVRELEELPPLPGGDMPPAPPAPMVEQPASIGAES